jgi:sodium-dependent dicarboxylate transporter 2/3/5
LKKIGLFGGPIAFVLILLISPATMPKEAVGVLAGTAWVAIWWITEAISIYPAALLPILLFPLTGSVPIKETAEAYGHPFIFLFLGGFIIAKAIERWNLHKRIALNIINFMGTDLNKIVLGFMVATAFISMWISNTATSVMMLPIGLAVINQIGAAIKENFGKALVISIAYSASIGGIATLIGTPPNLVLAGVLKEYHGYTISFQEWLFIGLPFSICMLIICWLYLTRKAFPMHNLKLDGGREVIKTELQKLGKISAEEKIVGIIFGLAAFSWVTQTFLLKKFIPFIDDTLIAVFFALLFFIIPSKGYREPILKWSEAVKLPWGVLLLYGGGLAIANGFQSSGLAVWIGGQLSALEGMHVLIVIILVVTLMNFLTEITSNLAMTAMLLPVLAALPLGGFNDTLQLMVGATMAASCAFMLPVATPPNSVVFGSGLLKIQDMVRTGIWINLISIVVIVILVYLIF